MAELAKGWVSQETLERRIELVEKFVDHRYLPVKQGIYDSDVFDLAQEYGPSGRQTSLTDLILGSLTKHHKDLLLLTANFRDFPNHVFPSNHIFFFSIAAEKRAIISSTLCLITILKVVVNFFLR